MPLPQARDVQHGRACGSTDDQNSLEGRSSVEGRMDMSAAETNSMLRKEISLLTLRLKSYETESCRSQEALRHECSMREKAEAALQELNEKHMAALSKMSTLQRSVEALQYEKEVSRKEALQNEMAKNKSLDEKFLRLSALEKDVRVSAQLIVQELRSCSDVVNAEKDCIKAGMQVTTTEVTRHKKVEEELDLRDQQNKELTRQLCEFMKQCNPRMLADSNQQLQIALGRNMVLETRLKAEIDKHAGMPGETARDTRNFMCWLTNMDLRTVSAETLSKRLLALPQFPAKEIKNVLKNRYNISSQHTEKESLVQEYIRAAYANLRQKDNVVQEYDDDDEDDDDDNEDEDYDDDDSYDFDDLDDQFVEDCAHEVDVRRAKDPDQEGSGREAGTEGVEEKEVQAVEEDQMMDAGEEAVSEVDQVEDAEEEETAGGEADEVHWAGVAQSNTSEEGQDVKGPAEIVESDEDGDEELDDAKGEAGEPEKGDEDGNGAGGGGSGALGDGHGGSEEEDQGEGMDIEESEVRFSDVNVVGAEEESGQGNHLDGEAEEMARRQSQDRKEKEDDSSKDEPKDEEEEEEEEEEVEEEEEGEEEREDETKSAAAANEDETKRKEEEEKEPAAEARGNGRQGQGEQSAAPVSHTSNKSAKRRGKPQGDYSEFVDEIGHGSKRQVVKRGRVDDEGGRKQEEDSGAAHNREKRGGAAVVKAPRGVGKSRASGRSASVQQEEAEEEILESDEVESTSKRMSSRESNQSCSSKGGKGQSVSVKSAAYAATNMSRTPKNSSSKNSSSTTKTNEEDREVESRGLSVRKTVSTQGSPSTSSIGSTASKSRRHKDAAVSAAAALAVDAQHKRATDGGKHTYPHRNAHPRMRWSSTLGRQVPADTPVSPPKASSPSQAAASSLSPSPSKKKSLSPSKKAVPSPNAEERGGGGEEKKKSSSPLKMAVPSPKVGGTVAGGQGTKGSGEGTNARGIVSERSGRGRKGTDGTAGEQREQPLVSSVKLGAVVVDGDGEVVMRQKGGGGGGGVGVSGGGGEGGLCSEVVVRQKTPAKERAVSPRHLRQPNAEVTSEEEGGFEDRGRSRSSSRRPAAITKKWSSTLGCFVDVSPVKVKVEQVEGVCKEIPGRAVGRHSRAGIATAEIEQVSDALAVGASKEESNGKTRSEPEVTQDIGDGGDARWMNERTKSAGKELKTEVDDDHLNGLGRGRGKMSARATTSSKKRKHEEAAGESGARGSVKRHAAGGVGGSSGQHPEVGGQVESFSEIEVVGEVASQVESEAEQSEVEIKKEDEEGVSPGWWPFFSKITSRRP